MDKLSPKVWSQWTNGPLPIWSPGQTVPIKFGSPGQMVPQNLVPWTNGPLTIWSPYLQIITACPTGQTEYFRDHLSRVAKLVGDHLSMETEFDGDRCSKGINFMRVICPGGPEVRELKWVWDQTCRSQYGGHNLPPSWNRVNSSAKIWWGKC